MDFQQIKLFLHLAESRNFGQTAVQNNMTASTLSRQIQRIEAFLGEKLFIRDNRKVLLTKAGEIFLPFAQQSWQQWCLLKQNINNEAEQIQGELRLFCSVTAAYSHLPRILERFREYYPKVEIKLTTGDPALAVQYLQSSMADLALAGKPNSLPASLQFHYIDDITLSLIAPKIGCTTTQLLQEKSIDWEKIPFILPAEGPARQRIDQWFQAKKIKYPKIYATVSGHEGIVSMVALGCGLAMLPDVVIKNSPMVAQISYLPLDVEIQSFELGVCAQKKMLQTPLVNAFWQLL